MQVLKAGWGYGSQVFALLGAISLVVWIVSVVRAKEHHPLTYWLVVTLALFLVSALIWGYKRGKSEAGHTLVMGDQILSQVVINQVMPGQVPQGAPPPPVQEGDA